MSRSIFSGITYGKIDMSAIISGRIAAVMPEPQWLFFGNGHFSLVNLSFFCYKKITKGRRHGQDSQTTEFLRSGV